MIGPGQMLYGLTKYGRGWRVDGNPRVLRRGHPRIAICLYCPVLTVCDSEQMASPGPPVSTACTVTGPRPAIPVHCIEKGFGGTAG